MGEGRAYVLTVREGFVPIVQYYPEHVTKGERVIQRVQLVNGKTDARFEKRKQETARKKKTGSGKRVQTNDKM